MRFEPFLSIRLCFHQSNWSPQSLCSNAFRFCNLIYTNKNTNNTQKYPMIGGSGRVRFRILPTVSWYVAGFPIRSGMLDWVTLSNSVTHWVSSWFATWWIMRTQGYISSFPSSSSRSLSCASTIRLVIMISRSFCSSSVGASIKLASPYFLGASRLAMYFRASIISLAYWTSVGSQLSAICSISSKMQWAYISLAWAYCFANSE